ncbi:hypothetical protein [Streptomyces cucumeris]|uniref:hypothetical protein n=1 Tax=Streptomyces cucumeris TaxID=2962890 RepID=UPI0020C88E78|nr:hypothetical protein [Streptomyces sp. NEAU-Y11]MCP9209691.1 hypothetical protein [Streptomyces sp. NEAU-Y11]
MTKRDVEITPSAGRALRRLWRSDVTAARRIQRIVDDICAGVTPQKSVRMTSSSKTRTTLGAVPYKVADGKIRVVFEPGKRIIAIGYRKDVYVTIFGSGGWGR